MFQLYSPVWRPKPVTIVLFFFFLENLEINHWRLVGGRRHGTYCPNHKPHNNIRHRRDRRPRVPKKMRKETKIIEKMRKKNTKTKKNNTIFMINIDNESVRTNDIFGWNIIVNEISWDNIVYGIYFLKKKKKKKPRIYRYARICAKNAKQIQ